MSEEVRTLTYVEIDVDYCSLDYGVGACPAVLGVDSASKCFNTLRTCPVKASFANTPVTLRFAIPTAYLPKAPDAIPSLRSVSLSPGRISLGEDLGQRSSLSATFEDHPWSDTGPGGDKYLGDRSYDPFKQGSFFGKFRARQPYLRGRPLRLIRGYEGQAFADMEVRHFIIESFNGPSLDGKFSITAKDILKLADDDRAQAPRPSSGYLLAAVSATAVTATLAPAGIGNTEYAEDGYLNLGGTEIVRATRDVTAGNDADTILLLHMDGADASTLFPDSSASARTATAVGNAQVDTADFWGGTGAALFDGTGDWINLPDSNDWTFAGNFTIDCRSKCTSLAAARTYFSHSTDANNQYRLQVSTAGALNFSVISASATIVTMTSANGVIVSGTAYHIAVVRNGNVWSIYVNGASVATTTDSDAIPNFTSNFRIAAAGANALPFVGWIDEFRVSKVARWTTTFTPPPGPYSSSTDEVWMTRGQLGTAAVAHEELDRAQVVLRYSGQDAADILRDLFVTYAGVPDAYIPILNWQGETAAYNGRVYTATIAEPTGVNSLASELIQQAALAVWWDDIEQEIELRVLRSIAASAARFTPENTSVGSLSVDEQPDKRLSQVWIYYGQYNPLRPIEEKDNYRSLAIRVDLDAEADYGSAAILKVFSRWVPPFGDDTADRFTALRLGRFVNPPRLIRWAIPRFGVDTVTLGEGYRIEGWPIQDETGAAADAPVQVIGLDPGETAFVAEAEEVLFKTYDAADLSARNITISADTYEFDLLDVHNNIFPALTDADVLAGVTLTCTIQPGVTVGSSSNLLYAFSVPAGWPVGFVPKVINLGRIEGKGGNGGNGAGGANVTGNGAPGQAGGPALLVASAIELTNDTGEVWGGGGGGGGSASPTAASFPAASRSPGGGGGGGAGYSPGLKGTGVYSFQPAPTDGTPDAGGEGPASSGGAPLAGDGGDPGTAGNTGLANAPDWTGGAGGAAGLAIQGDSLITFTGIDGDIRGTRAG